MWWSVASWPLLVAAPSQRRQRVVELAVRLVPEPTSEALSPPATETPAHLGEGDAVEVESIDMCSPIQTLSPRTLAWGRLASCACPQVKDEFSAGCDARDCVGLDPVGGAVWQGSGI